MARTERLEFMEYAFEPAPQASLAIKDSDQRFPVRRVFCVGRNYGDHAREMGHDPDREPPFFFTKPADAVFDMPEKLPYPPETDNLHHEIELVVLIGKGGTNIAKVDADNHVFGYAVGLDMTRRNLQTAAKKLGRPWDWGKAFDYSAPCGPVHQISETGKIHTGSIWLNVNEQRRQTGNIADLIWSVDEVIAIISHSMKLQAGDVIMTGTPAGVGPVVSNDKITAGIDSLGQIETILS